MSTSTDDNWSSCPPRTKLVSIQSHSLSLSCSGPPRLDGSPVVVIIQGIASSTKEWPVIIHSVSMHTRIYSYDRSGFGLSEVSPHDQSAEQIATELDYLLLEAKIDPPYVLVSHSYGGIIAREFVHRRGPGAIVGIVFVDANTDETPGTYPNPAVQALSRGLDTLEVTIGGEHRLSSDEWKALMEEENDERNGQAGKRELEFYHESGRLLTTRAQGSLRPPLLEDYPIIVLHANYARDLQKIYDAGCLAGNGTTEERHEMAKFVEETNGLEERMQRKMLDLSTNAKFIHVEGSGHYIHMVQPDIVIQAVRDVLGISQPES